MRIKNLKDELEDVKQEVLKIEGYEDWLLKELIRGSSDAQQTDEIDMLNDISPPTKSPTTLDKHGRVTESDSQKVPIPSTHVPTESSSNMQATTPSYEFGLMYGSQTQPLRLTLSPKVLFSNMPPLEHATQDTGVGEEGSRRKRKKCDV